jgi:hypothetical protein
VTVIVTGDGDLTGLSTDSFNNVTKSSSDPTATANVALGHIWINTTTGDQYVCTSATTDDNEWTNVGRGEDNVNMTRPIVATGGTITTDGDWKIHTFTSSGTFTVTDAGKNAGNVEYLIIAGGGSGGGRKSSSRGAAGGAGAGGYRSSCSDDTYSGGGASVESAITVTAQAYAVTIGAGGSGVGEDAGGIQGNNSSALGITSTGGGRGSCYDAATYRNGGDGGSAGGGATYGVSGTPVSGQGYAGGGTVSSYDGSGGGGAGAVGATATSSGTAGAGGAGQYSLITGTSTARAGGGGGSAYSANQYGSGGVGGGGHGDSGSGTANTGGGGGAAKWLIPSGSGGSGIVILRYKFQNL